MSRNWRLVLYLCKVKLKMHASMTLNMQAIHAMFLLRLLSLYPPTVVSSRVTYHIKPTLQSPCDFDSCYTLSVIVSDINRDRYFTTNVTNVTLVFLPGMHVLDTGVVLLDQLESLTFLGDSTSAPNITSTIICNGSSGFVFKQISTLEIERLVFTKCGNAQPSNVLHTIRAKENYSHIYLPTLTILSLTRIFIGNCKMEHNYLALFTNGSLVHIHNTAFVENAGESGDAMQVIGGRAIFTGTNWFHNNKADSGGGVYIDNAQLYLKGSVEFHANDATLEGGAIKSVNEGKIYFDQPNRDTVQTVETCFIENSAEHGGSISLSHSQIIQNRRHTLRFSDNIANNSGGAIDCYFGSFVWEGMIMFKNSTAVHGNGGAIDTRFCEWHSMGATIFARNTANAGDGGAIYLSTGRKASFSGATSFIENKAQNGGGISTNFDSVVQFNTTAELTCSGNYAEFSGGWLFGGFFTSDTIISIGSRSMKLLNNSAGEKGGTIFLSGTGDKLNIKLTGEGQLQNSSATFGGAIAINNASITICGVYNFQNNFANHGGAMLVSNGHIYLQGKHTFTKNNARHNENSGYGGGIYALKTGITIEGEVNFIGNSAGYGGGLAYADYSHAESRLLYLRANTMVQFLNNHAYTHGGGIEVEEAAVLYCSLPSQTFLNYKTPCFFHVDDHGCSPRVPSDTTHLIFKANTAARGGNDIFGGILEKCSTECIHIPYNMLGSDALNQLVVRPFKQIPGKHSNITSNPFLLCHCQGEGLKPNCSTSQITKKISPGETIHIDLVAIGQMNGTSPAVVHAASENYDEDSIDIIQSTQPVNMMCTPLVYNVLKKSSSNTKLKLFIEQPACGELGNSITILVEFLPCPIGFVLSQSGVCICDYRLQKHTNSCDIDSRNITRSSNFWVGYNNQSHGLILHPHCPFDYCTLETISFPLNSTDQQCVHGRSGTLCGACKSGLSLNLGSSRCSSCSNIFVLLLLPFAAAGFLLVIFLFTCKLTVSAGTTSGLIFYANVVAVNRSVFFPPGETNILTVFIAWLNLDLGIETCFFDGMDAYTRTWLQFVFPLYIWSLVGLISLASHYSMTVARIISPTNPVAVLATLFLLSYTKLLRTIIATFSFTTLDYPDNHKVPMWAYDGNMDYLKGQHVVIFLVGLTAFLVLFLPYSSLLLFGQCFIAHSNHSVLSWVNKPIPRSFLDAYHAPFQNRHRYWVGLLLVLRLILLIISVVIDINSPRDPSINLLFISVTCIGLMALTWNTGGVYKKWYCNVLESSFIVNLAILAAASYQVKVEGGNKQAVVYTSMGAAFVTFMVTIAYNVIEQVRDTRVWRNSIKPALTYFGAQDQDNELDLAPPPTAPPPKVTTTYIELREPLLDT